MFAARPKSVINFQLHFPGIENELGFRICCICFSAAVCFAPFPSHLIFREKGKSFVFLCAGKVFFNWRFAWTVSIYFFIYFLPPIPSTHPRHPVLNFCGWKNFPWAKWKSYANSQLWHTRHAAKKKKKKYWKRTSALVSLKLSWEEMSAVYHLF